MNRYYKQSLKPVKDVALISQVSRHYKALGWKSHDGRWSKKAEMNKENLKINLDFSVAENRAYALNMVKEINRVRFKNKLHIGLQQNKIRMGHFRRQYGF